MPPKVLYMELRLTEMRMIHIVVVYLGACHVLTVSIGPIHSPILFFLSNIALSNAGTIAPGEKVPNLPPAALPLG